jgi:acetylornithine/N-succinyldiaminopimelate aminotransferase
VRRTGCSLLSNTIWRPHPEGEATAFFFALLISLTEMTTLMKSNDYNSLFMPTFSRSGAPLISGKGMYLVDADNKKYLDFGAGIAVNALGHSHDEIVGELCEQGSKLLHISNLYISEPAIEIAKLLIKNSFGSRIFLCNSGTEAIEAAIKFARKSAFAISKGKYHILTFNDGFHGRTYGAMSATAQKKFHQGFYPILPGFHYAPFNDISATRAVLAKHKFAAIMLEPLQAEGGVNLASKEFMKFLREWCDNNKALLIFDEIQCGMGRTGKLWCYEHYGIIPDIMTLAKPIGGGLPLGAVICTETIAKAIKPGDHGTTFGGNPLACALGCIMLKTIAKKNFLRQVETNGLYLREKLEALKSKFPVIEEVRGLGLLIGVRISIDPLAVIAKCREHGLLLIKAEHHMARFLPPLIVSKKDIDKAVSIFEKSLNSLK